MIEIFFFKNFLNKLTFKSKKLKFFNKIVQSIKTLKKKKLNMNILFYFIIIKLKPMFRIIKEKKKTSKIVPKFITNFNGYKTASSWFLLPLI
jgi:hypothetical protein